MIESINWKIKISLHTHVCTCGTHKHTRTSPNPPSLCFYLFTMFNNLVPSYMIPNPPRTLKRDPHSNKVYGERVSRRDWWSIFHHWIITKESSIDKKNPYLERYDTSRSVCRRQSRYKLDTECTLVCMDSLSSSSGSRAYSFSVPSGSGTRGLHVPVVFESLVLFIIF